MYFILLTEEIVKQRLFKKGYILIGDYKSSGEPIVVMDKDEFYYFPICSNILRGLKPEIIGKSNPYSFMNMEHIISGLGKGIFTILNKKYINSFQRIFLIDNLGFKYETCWACINKKCIPRKFNLTNRYTIYNIQLFLKLNSLSFVLLNKKYKGYHEKLKFKCINCNKPFMKTLTAIIDAHEECPNCRELPKGELKIKRYLDSKNVEYISQKSFDDCKDKRKLKFDFYLPNYNICIEYNGIQHYKAQKSSLFYGEDFLKDRQKKDNIKKEYCISNNIGFIEISYKQFSKIETILSEHL